MQTIQAIIEKSGGFAQLKQRPIRIGNSGHPLLVIEYLGKTRAGGLCGRRRRDFRLARTLFVPGGR